MRKPKYEDYDNIKKMTRIYSMYIDESGDPGTYSENNVCSGTRHYIISGIIIPSDTWKDNLHLLATLKSQLKSNYGFPIRKELHGSQIINPRNDTDFKKIGSRKWRNHFYLECMRYYSSNIIGLKIINIHVDKMSPHSVGSFSGKNIQDLAWIRLMERYQTFLSKEDGLGLVFADDTNEDGFRKLLRRMRKHHYVGSKYKSSGFSVTTENIIEDPIIRSSHQSYFIQIADMTCHSLYRKLYPKPSYKRYKTEQIFDILDSVLVKEAHASCPYEQGIVRV